MSLSEGLFYGDGDEHVSETQFRHEPTKNINEAVTPIEPPTNYACDIPCDSTDQGNENAT